MSYDIMLVDPITRKCLQLDTPHLMRGGTYILGGTEEAALNVTYNYAAHYDKVLHVGSERGIRGLHGMSGADSIPLLERAAAALKDDKVDDYWDPTEGNAKSALLQFVALAKMRPDGVWDVD